MSTLIIWLVVLYVGYLVLQVLDALMQDSVEYEKEQHTKRNKRGLDK